MKWDLLKMNQDPFSMSLDPILKVRTLFWMIHNPFEWYWTNIGFFLNGTRLFCQVCLDWMIAYLTFMLTQDPGSSSPFHFLDDKVQVKVDALSIFPTAGKYCHRWNNRMWHLICERMCYIALNQNDIENSKAVCLSIPQMWKEILSLDLLQVGLTGIYGSRYLVLDSRNGHNQFFIR